LVHCAKRTPLRKHKSTSRGKRQVREKKGKRGNEIFVPLWKKKKNIPFRASQKWMSCLSRQRLRQKKAALDTPGKKELNLERRSTSKERQKRKGSSYWRSSPGKEKKIKLKDYSYTTPKERGDGRPYDCARRNPSLRRKEGRGRSRGERGGHREDKNAQTSDKVKKMRCLFQRRGCREN